MGLAGLPPELKIEIYTYLGPTHLLAISHISKSWRSVVLADPRWAKWLDMIVNPESSEKARDFMARFKLLDAIPARTIVTLCFATKCSLCPKDTTFIFLPLLKRICSDCMHPETHAVMALSAALTTYDLSEKDVKDIVVLHWEETDVERKKTEIITRAKLVSRLAVKNIAIEKHGSEENLTTHLQYKKARVRKAYNKRLAEYSAATLARVPGTPAAVPPTKTKKVAKTRPKIPAILKDAPFTPPFYQWVSVLPTTFLVGVGGGGAVEAQRLVECTLCNTVANLRWQDLDVAERDDEGPRFPPYMLSGRIPAHEAEVHYAVRERACYAGCHIVDEDTEDIGLPARCETCLNAEALEMRDEQEED